MTKVTSVRPSLIKKYAYAAGLPPRSHGGQRIYAINEQAFDEVNEQSAYWLGFLTGDGCFHVDKTGAPQIRLNIKEADHAHVIAFRDFLQADYPVKIIPNTAGKGGPQAAIAFRSWGLYNAARRHGIAYPSTDRDPSPELLQNRHFWRGLIDADGNVGMPLPGKSASCWQISLYAHDPLIGHFMAYCEELGVLGNSKRIYLPGVMRLRLHGSRARKLLATLYQPGDFALPRKAEIGLQAATFQMQRTHKLATA